MACPDVKKRLKVLLIAYQCAPEGGSVSMIGWHWFKYLKPFVNLHLVTHIRHQHDLEQVLDVGDSVIYVDTEWFAGPMYRFSQRLLGNSQHIMFMLANLDFLMFGYKANRDLKSLHANDPFDICQVVTPVSPRAPHCFYKIGPATVLGPLNGSMPPLRGFPDISTREQGWLYPLRRFAGLATWLMGTHRHADLILSATAQNDNGLSSKVMHKVHRLCENGVDEVCDSVPPFPPLPPAAPLKLLFAGRLVPIKGLPMLLHALKGIQSVHLCIVGEGPEETLLRQQVRRLHLEDRVTFIHFQPQALLAGYYKSCHLHVLLSVRESGGATILEAMAQGRPTLALDHGGPGEYITPETGILLPMENARQVVQDLGKQLRALIDHPKRLIIMAEAGLRRVRSKYTWSSKIEAALAIYDDLLSKQRQSRDII